MFVCNYQYKASGIIRKQFGVLLNRFRRTQDHSSLNSRPSFLNRITGSLQPFMNARTYFVTSSYLHNNPLSGETSTQDNPEYMKNSDLHSSYSPWVLDAEVFMIPHPEKKHKGGEDAYAISKNGKLLAVFDGVGGWAEVGVDPREYAVKLSEGFQIAVDSQKIHNPKEALKFAYKFAKSVVGSSTACTVALDGDTIHSANVGDSGFLIVRPPDSLIFRSEEQQHTFNQPYQLGYQSSDTPESADCHSIKVQEGDLVLLCTDGLLDNLDEENIINTIKEEYELSGKEINIKRLAKNICKKAYQVSQNPKAVTPFGIHARQHGYRYRGGKPDDITLIVSVVSTPEKVILKEKSISMETEDEVQDIYKLNSNNQSSSLFHKLIGLKQWFSMQSRL